MRYFIELSYDGTPFVGWQRQPAGDSVQSCLEDALSILFRKPLSIVGAGRTDAGVHAHQLFAHVDLDEHVDQDLTFRLNKLLPKEIAVRNIIAVAQDAHARFDAVSRSYRYHITTQKNPFMQKRSYQFAKPLDLELMNQAAKTLIDHEDFKCFSKSKTDVKTYMCDIQHAHWQHNGSELVFFIQANRFLRNMVRAIVGTLIEVGLRKISISDFEAILASRDRSQAGYSVPAHGLYLEKVNYPNHIFAV
ncbi:MAG: tRNA pseudouridine(38-40) synthase TruA [Flavobacteriaceae bacterium]|nr:tRNA pseudouridine(38-40) synthase TruA [Flavobacteriaceae bacterium]